MPDRAIVPTEPVSLAERTNGAEKIRVLTPQSRKAHRFPWWSPLAIGIAALVSILAQWIDFTPLDIAHAATWVAAVISAVALAMWLEDRIYAAMLGRHPVLRVIVGLLVPVLGLVVLLPVAALLGILVASLGDEAVTLTSLLAMALWFCSAGLGSLVVVIIDAVISAILKDFRSRVQVAVLGLLMLTSGFAVAIYGAARALAENVRTMRVEDMGPGWSVDLGEGKLSPSELNRLLSMSETADVVAVGFFLLVGILAFPAVVSATGKLAEAVMERLHPLSIGFRHVAEGDLAVRVEEKGSRDFVRIGQGFNQMAAALSETLTNLDDRNRELTEINEASRRFVPFEFLQLLRKKSIRDVHRGDQTELSISILFSDIRGFTPLAEQLGPEATFQFINRYLSFMEPEIHANLGFINDFAGDGIMALFHTGARDAVDAGVGMLRAVERFNGELIAEGQPPIQVGIGIHTGRLMLGTIGGRDRLDCTVIGDPANLASRVEGMTKMYGARLLITEATLTNLADPSRYLLREVDRVRAKGKRDPVTIFEVLDPELDRDKMRTKAAFERGLQAFREADFETAANLFGACRIQAEHDLAATLYVQRVQHYAEHGVPQGWSGITDLRSK